MVYFLCTHCYVLTMLLLKRYPSLVNSEIAKELEALSNRPFMDFVKDVVDVTELTDEETNEYMQQLDNISLGPFNPYFYWDAWPASVADKYRYLYDAIMQILHRRYLVDCFEKGVTLRDICLAVEDAQDDAAFEYMWFLRLLSAANHAISQTLVNTICGCLLTTNIDLDALYSFMQDNNLKFDITTVFCSCNMNADFLKIFITRGGLVPSNTHICLWFAHANKKNSECSIFFNADNKAVLDMLHVILDYGAYPSFHTVWAEELHLSHNNYRYDCSNPPLVPYNTGDTLSQILNQDADDVSLIDEGVGLLVDFLHARPVSLIEKFVDCYDHCKNVLGRSAWRDFEQGWMTNLRQHRHHRQHPYHHYFLIKSTILMYDNINIRTWLLHVMLDYPLPHNFEL